MRREEESGGVQLRDDYHSFDVGTSRTDDEYHSFEFNTFGREVDEQLDVPNVTCDGYDGSDGSDNCDGSDGSDCDGSDGSQPSDLDYSAESCEDSTDDETLDMMVENYPCKKRLQQYLLQLQRNPLRTQMITAGVLSAVSDVAAQKLSAIQKLQPKRLLLKVIFGSAYLCPLSHYFHILLDKIFKGKKDTKTVAKKVVLEQLTISPWNNLMFMIYTTASLSLQYLLLMHVIGRPWIHTKSKIKKEYPTVIYMHRGHFHLWLDG
ncbi:uncharacterized protein LOC121810706 [Salvia splendens]|uniref:uncharacterized protein LOC121810706 n=1 Tax=Salvia splendens TaxID=180675 RepID=UPI001C253283|nr:uncharacterized protein LOC121810706 [Salvia splendens]